MLERGRGKIVNVCSIQSALARPGIAPYAATKGGLKLLTQGMCADWGPSGLQVNAIAPGYFETEMTRALVEDPDSTRGCAGARRPPAGAGRTSSSARCSSSPRPRRTSSTARRCSSDGGMSAVV